MNAPTIFFSGIQLDTTRFWVPPTQVHDLAQLSFDKEIAPQSKVLVPTATSATVEKAGWGLVVPYGQEQAYTRALSRLLDLRKSQVGSKHTFGIYSYLPGEDKFTFLTRHLYGPGTVDPEQFPYYLLLVGSPEEIPFHFQYALAQQFAVGRLYLESTEGYIRYAENVIAHERENQLHRELAIFAPGHEGDDPTRMSVDHMARPLSEELAEAYPHWEVNPYLNAVARRSCLSELLESSPPALLFAAGHGLCVHHEDPRYDRYHGSILCADWRGRHAGEDAGLSHAFTTDDLTDSMDLSGTMVWLHTCSSAGAPRTSIFKDAEPAPQAIISALPKAMLAHPGGPALAVIAHVDTTYYHSFLWEDARQKESFENLATFKSVLSHLMMGLPVGRAMVHFSAFCAELALAQVQPEVQRSLARQHFLRMACLDLRNFVLFGDPAVSLRMSP